MRKFSVALLAGVALSIAGSGLALAADLPVKAPVHAAAYNWAGCYVGLHGGAGWANTSFSNTNNTTLWGDLVPGQGFSQTNSGFVGGGQLGCNWQTNQFVYGLEGTFSGSSIKGDVNNNAFGGQDDVFTTKINSIATVVGRLGYAANNWLFYAKGGYAGANVNFGAVDTNGANQGAGSQSVWHNGWTLGAGVEYGLTANWIVGLEYSYIGLQTKSHEVGGGAGLYTFDVQPKISELLARVSYKF